MVRVSPTTGRRYVVTTIALSEDTHTESRALGINRSKIAEQAIVKEIERLKNEQQEKPL